MYIGTCNFFATHTRRIVIIAPGIPAMPESRVEETQTEHGADLSTALTHTDHRADQSISIDTTEQIYG